MPLTIAAPSATIARAIAEHLPGLAHAQGVDVTFRDTPHRGEPGIYKAPNGELALATQGTTQAQRSFLADLFQGEFRQYPAQDALYFTTQCPVLHPPSHLASSYTPDHTATSPMLPVDAAGQAAVLNPTLSLSLPPELAQLLETRLPRLVAAIPTGVMFRPSRERGRPGLYFAKGGELALSTASLDTTEKGLLKAIFHGGYRTYSGPDALYFTAPSPSPSAVFLASAAPDAMPALADLPRLAELADIVPLLSQGHSFADVEMPIRDAAKEWVRPFDWIAWKTSDEAIALRDTDLLNQATPAQLEKLLTTIIRQDRFCDGTLEAAYETKLLARIAQRAAAILQPSLEIPHSDI
jgi:Family of unknown function (DUF6508)